MIDDLAATFGLRRSDLNIVSRGLFLEFEPFPNRMPCSLSAQHPKVSSVARPFGWFYKTALRSMAIIMRSLTERLLGLGHDV